MFIKLSPLTVMNFFSAFIRIMHKSTYNSKFIYYKQYILHDMFFQLSPLLVMNSFSAFINVRLL